MARRKKGKAVNGWLILDKPIGMTSTQAVGAVRRLFDARKAGHAGTLDPLATGILPIALGEATKTVPYAVVGTHPLSQSPRPPFPPGCPRAPEDPGAPSSPRPPLPAVTEHCEIHTRRAPRRTMP